MDIKRKINHAPHVVLLGAGASLAAFPNGDANGRRLPMMRNLVEVIGLEDLLATNGVNEGYNNFEALYDGLATDNSKPVLLRALENQIQAYFSEMQLPQEVTLYDLLLLSLREKDVVATFNWDPFLAQAFRRNRLIQKLPRLLFLHGNVEVGSCNSHRRSGFIEQKCSICGSPMSPSQLLYPVKHKDYTTDPFIHSEWMQLQSALERAYLLTIFGYSAPITDVEARNLLLDKWKQNPTRDLAEIEVVDIRSEKDIRDSWSEFFIRQHYRISAHIEGTLSFSHPRRSCEAFAMATLQLEPWKENPFPKTRNLDEMHAWLQPLLKEEALGTFTGEPCARG